MAFVAFETARGILKGHGFGVTGTIRSRECQKEKNSEAL